MSINFLNILLIPPNPLFFNFNKILPIQLFHSIHFHLYFLVCSGQQCVEDHRRHFLLRFEKWHGCCRKLRADNPNVNNKWIIKGMGAGYDQPTNQPASLKRPPESAKSHKGRIYFILKSSIQFPLLFRRHFQLLESNSRSYHPPSTHFFPSF
jgi:hypothetical protein